MVAKITIPKSLQATLNYNEKKVQNEDAVCLHAEGYLKDARDLNFYQKLAGFERLNALNERATTKTLHVSLNFDPAEKHSDEKLIAIANTYMKKIGFGKQPFLVYKHNDAGHPHIHIVSTTIKPDGNRINTHNIGRNQSEKARKEIEQEFSLVKAEKQQHKSQSIKAIYPTVVVYGKSTTKKSIAAVVTMVFNEYKFASLPEFNAALLQFNIVADRGKEDGRIYKHRGLIYRVLDARGNKIGVPIKASSISCQPTLNNLERKFTGNQMAKDSLKAFLRSKLDDCLFKQSASMNDLTIELKTKNIYTVQRQNAEGRLYGITFVDNQNKVVFNGSDLGKGYSAAALQSRLVNFHIPPLQKSVEKNIPLHAGIAKQNHVYENQEKNVAFSIKTSSLAEILLATNEQQASPNALLKKKRKKKKKKPDF